MDQNPTTEKQASCSNFFCFYMCYFAEIPHYRRKIFAGKFHRFFPFSRQTQSNVYNEHKSVTLTHLKSLLLRGIKRPASFQLPQRTLPPQLRSCHRIPRTLTHPLLLPTLLNVQSSLRSQPQQENHSPNFFLFLRRDSFGSEESQQSSGEEINGFILTITLKFNEI